MAVPIPFIQQKAEEFVVCDEAVRILNQITGKIAVVVVAGPYRTGKSFLLNRLIGRQSGFSVGNTISACTKGIWLWGDPVKIRDITYLFLDSEGLGSLDQSNSFDTQILSLAVLLSSLFILNTTGTITENALEQLDLVAQCSKRIKVSQSESGPEALARHFPAFIWVLRDFSLELKTQDRVITPQIYLEEALQNKAGGRAAEKNRTRDTIKTVFPDRDCITLVRPAADEKQLQNLSKVDYKSLRKEFQDGMTFLHDTVYRKATPKMFDGNFLNGPALLGLAKSYCQCLNKGDIPVIQSSWQSVVAIQGHEGIEMAIKLYRQAIASDKVYDRDDFADLDSKARNGAIRLLKERAVGDELQMAQLEKDLHQKLDIIAKERWDLNEARSKDLCNNLIQQAWDKIGVEHKEFSDLKTFTTDRLAVMEEYKRSARGSGKMEVAWEFIIKKMDVVLHTLFQRAASAHAEKENLLAERVEREKALKEADKIHNQLKMELQKSALQLETYQHRSAQDIRTLQESVHERNSEIKDLKKERDELSKTLNNSHRTYTELEIKLGHMTERERNLSAELAKQKNTIDSLNNDAKKESDGLRKAGMEVTKQLQDTEAKHGQEKKRWAEKEKHDALQMGKQKEQLDQTIHTLNTLRQEHKQLEEQLKIINSTFETSKKQWEDKEQRFAVRINHQKDQQDITIAEVQSLRKQEGELKERFNELEVKYGEESSKTSYLSDLLQQQKNRVAELEANLSQTKSALTSLKVEHKSLEESRLRIESELSNTNNSASQKISQLTSNRDQLVKQLEEKKNRVAELETSSSQMKAALASAKAENKSLEETRQRIESKLANTSDAASHEISQMKLKNDQLSKQLEDKKQSIQHLEVIRQQTQEQLQAVLSEKDTLRNQLDTTSQKLKKQLLELEDSLSQTAAELQNVVSQRDSNAKEFDQFSKKLKKQILDLETSVTILKTEKKSLEENQSKLSNSKDAASQEISHLKTKVEQLSKVMEDKTRSVENLERSLQQSQKKLQEMTLAKQDLSDQLTQSQLQFNKQLETSGASVQDKERLITKLEKERNQLEKELESTQREVQDYKILQSELKTMTEQLTMERNAKEREKKEKSTLESQSRKTEQLREEEIQRIRSELMQTQQNLHQEKISTAQRLSILEEQKTTLEKELQSEKEKAVSLSEKLQQEPHRRRTTDEESARKRSSVGADEFFSRKSSSSSYQSAKEERESILSSSSIYDRESLSPVVPFQVEADHRREGKKSLAPLEEQDDDNEPEQKSKPDTAPKKGKRKKEETKEVKDLSKLSIPKLRSLLTANNITFSQSEKGKPYFLALCKKHGLTPDCESPVKPAAKKRTKTGR